MNWRVQQTEQPHIRHLSIRLLWSQQLCIIFFQVAVLSHLTALPVKHQPIAGAMRAVSHGLTHHTMTSVLLFMRTCVPRVPNMINYIFSPQLHLSNGKPLALPQETRPYASGFSIRPLWSHQPNGREPQWWTGFCHLPYYTVSCSYPKLSVSGLETAVSSKGANFPLCQQLAPACSHPQQNLSSCPKMILMLDSTVLSESSGAIWGVLSLTDLRFPIYCAHLRDLM